VSAPSIGPRLREARRRQGLSLSGLAERSGLTKGFLSQVERDLTSPSVGTLLRLCQALELPVGHLFDGAHTPIVRSGERTPIGFGGTAVSEFRLTPAEESRVMLILSEIAPGGGSGDDPYSLGSDAEVAYVLEGTLHLTVAGTRYVLAAGDTLSFDASAPHSWENPSAALPARVLWFLAPALD
jgi:transcriptional regulator with XRE-family HTH domain